MRPIASTETAGWPSDRLRQVPRLAPGGRLWLISLLTIFCATLACRDNRPRPPLVFTPDVLPDASVGQPYNTVLRVTQNVTPVFDFSAPATDLPPGLTIHLREDHQSAELAGTPTQAGKFTFIVRALCYGTSVNGQAGTKTYTLVVK
jgi:hypothetical protein